MGLGEDEQPAQFVLIEIFDIVEEIPIETHRAQATSAGANNRTMFRRSVSVQPIGGVSRSAWVTHTG
jgi:hypothetical protein